MMSFWAHEQIEEDQQFLWKFKSTDDNLYSVMINYEGSWKLYSPKVKDAVMTYEAALLEYNQTSYYDIKLVKVSRYLSAGKLVVTEILKNKAKESN